MKKSLLLLVVISVFFSCNQNNHFKVAGKVKDAAGQIIYLEHNGLLKTNVLDSVKLNESGEFSFEEDRPLYPDLYRLRLGGKLITFAVDSCEEITFTTQEKNFSTEYVVSGSPQSAQIQKLRKSVMNIQQKVDAMAELNSDQRQVKLLELQKDIEAHKQMAKVMILQNPRSMAAYFALYQQINGTYLFSPYVKEDSPFNKAVATSFNTFMPDYERSKNLYSLVLDAIKKERSAKSKLAWNELLEKAGKGYVDIELKDKKNVTHKLSDLEGQVVLIDFSAYDSEQSVEYTFALRDLYNKYHSKGFEIYQVSLDENKSLWEKSVENIPWVCVRDENGPNAVSVGFYNITTSPTTFLLDRKGNILAKSLSFKELDEQIQKYL